MIQRVYEKSKQCHLLTDLVVATDDKRIYDHIIDFGGKAVMTSSEHQSGTDRCLEALQKNQSEFDVVINIQGDEPFIDPAQITGLINCFEDKDTDIATLVKSVDHIKEIDNPSVVKVVINSKDQAMYFSRSIIPYVREVPKEKWAENCDFYRHVGIYGYTSKALEKITQLPISSYEAIEKLEQLRWLENGFKIKVAYTDVDSESIDTPEDLDRILGNMD